MYVSGFRRINLDALLKMLVLLGFALFFYSIVRSGQVQLYVHPRIVPYIKFGIVMMVLISLFYTRDLFKPKRRSNLAPYLLFLIPLILAFALPAKSMDSTSMSFGDMGIARKVGGAQLNSGPADNPGYFSPGDEAAGAGNDLNSDPSVLPGPDNSPDSLALAGPDPDQKDSGLKLQNDRVVMDDDNFVKWLQEIYEKMGVYEGKKIEVTGFVFKDKQFEKNEFVPARLMMACCTADLQPVGFLCRYDKASELKQDTWIKVTGRVKIIDYKGQKTPVIDAESIVGADKPKNEYVYPY